MAVWSMFNNTDCHICNKQIQKLRGCEEDLSSPVTLSGTDIQVIRCPLNYVTEIEKIYLNAYFQYGKGFLPNPGGWLGQPCKFTSIMTIIDNVINKFKTEREEKWQPKI